ncbi:DUF4236 domain-containing protein [Nonomuraea purpurea]|uniref:DUF4236 domain-containing protein n=1 Tax=Nonomuraea purpurea TaxID=1849276 RepID=A0ABV8G045_9ACTN
MSRDPAAAVENVFTWWHLVRRWNSAHGPAVVQRRAHDGRGGALGWHYNRSVKVGPFRINLSRHRSGMGGRRFHVSTTPDGRRHVTLRLPGGFHVGKTFGSPKYRGHY